MLILNYVINKLRNNYIYIPGINIRSFFITFFTVVTVCCFWFFGFILAFVANHVIPSLISDNPQNLPNYDASTCLLLKRLQCDILNLLNFYTVFLLYNLPQSYHTILQCSWLEILYRILLDFWWQYLLTVLFLYLLMQQVQYLKSCGEKGVKYFSYIWTI